MSRLSAIQKKMWSRHSLAWSWTNVQMARAAHRKQLLTGSVGAVKGVSRWSLDEHIPFRGESEKVRGERPSPGRQTLFRRNPAGCRIIDSKNHKTVPNINSCDHRGLIRYWSEYSHRHRSQKFIYIMNYCSHEERSQNQKKTFKSIPNINWKL